MGTLIKICETDIDNIGISIGTKKYVRLVNSQQKSLGMKSSREAKKESRNSPQYIRAIQCEAINKKNEKKRVFYEDKIQEKKVLF